MTVSEPIINWLKSFGDRKMKKIDTDMQSPDEYTYSLVKEPIRNVKAYISGRKVYTEHYTLQARLPSYYEPDRVDNHGFGEALENWVAEQDAKEAYPAIENAKVKGIDVTTPFYVGETTEHNSVYQMTIAIKYEKEN